MRRVGCALRKMTPGSTENYTPGKNQAISLEALHDSQGLRDLGERVGGLQQLLALVGRANHRP